jgi:hypothetical protein
MNTLGAFVRNWPRALSLRFKDAALAWQQANSVARYVSSYCAPLLSHRHQAADVRGTSHDLDYAINELMENVIKYAGSSEITLEVGVRESHIVINASTLSQDVEAERYRKRMSAMIAGDPQELLTKLIERRVELGETGSGLGLLSLRADYGAELAFEFKPVAGGKRRVTTQTRLPIRH